VIGTTPGGRRPVQAHWNRPAPQPESDEGGVRHQETKCQIIADEATYKAGRSQDLKKTGDLLLGRVRGLGCNQEGKGQVNLAVHSAPNDIRWGHRSTHNQVPGCDRESARIKDASLGKKELLEQCAGNWTRCRQSVDWRLMFGFCTTVNSEVNPPRSRPRGHQLISLNPFRGWFPPNRTNVREQNWLKRTMPTWANATSRTGACDTRRACRDQIERRNVANPHPRLIAA